MPLKIQRCANFTESDFKTTSTIGEGSKAHQRHLKSKQESNQWPSL